MGVSIFTVEVAIYASSLEAAAGWEAPKFWNDRSGRGASGDADEKRL